MTKLGYILRVFNCSRGFSKEDAGTQRPDMKVSSTCELKLNNEFPSLQSISLYHNICCAVVDYFDESEDAIELYPVNVV